MSDGRFAVTVEIGDSGFTTRVTAAGHELIADEPAAAGGADKGPTPYGYLLAALGTCSAMTVRMYADRKGWPVKRVRVGLRHERIHAEDCADCETDKGMISRITKRVEIAGDLSDEQRARLMEIADKCPVHRTLTSEIRIESELAGREG